MACFYNQYVVIMACFYSQYVVWTSMYWNQYVMELDWGIMTAYNLIWQRTITYGLWRQNKINKVQVVYGYFCVFVTSRNDFHLVLIKDY